MRTKPQTKLDDLAEEECWQINIPVYFNADNCDPPLEMYSHICVEKLGLLDRRFQDVAIVLCDLADKERKLLLVAATGGACDLVPERSVGDTDEKFDDRDFGKIVTVVDGWLVATTVGGSIPTLSFSVVLKERWKSAGRPTVLDVSLTR